MFVCYGYEYIYETGSCTRMRTITSSTRSMIFVMFIDDDGDDGGDDDGDEGVDCSSASRV